MFNLNRNKSQQVAKANENVFRMAFAAGLEAGIEMVRIAAAKKDGISLSRLADIMDQALVEFKEEDD